MISRKSSLSFGAVVAVSLSILSCGSSDDLALRDSKGDPGFERLRRREAVRVIVTATGEVKNTTAEYLLDDLEKICRLSDEYLSDPDNPVCEGSTACETFHCFASARLCAAHLLMEISGVVSEPFVIDTLGWEIPAQGTATNAALQRLAMEQALLAVEGATLELRAAGGIMGGSGGHCALGELADPAGTSDENLGRSFSMLIVEAHDLAKEAGLGAARDEVALADAYFSEHPTPRGAAELAFSAPLQSRASAVHLLIGGADGLYDELIDASSESTALCTAPPLSPGATAALSVFRESGVSPELMLELETDVPTADILLDEAGVRDALGELWQQSDWDSDTVTQFTGRFGLTTADFEEARHYFRQEMRAFGRSPLKHAPARTLAGGGVTTFERFASMVRPPAPPPYEFYTTIGRYEGGPTGDADVIPTPEYAQRGLAHLIDYIATEASVLFTATTWGAADDDVRVPLAAFLADVARERPARLLHLWLTDGSGQVGLYHPDDSTWEIDDLEMVTTTDGLQCAIYGSIEGEPCNWAEVGAVDPDVQGDPSIPEAGFVDSTIWDVDSTVERFYVLRKKDGATAETPGNYESVAGGWHTADTADYIEMYPVVPELSQLAGEYLTPSTSWCTHARETCAGTSFDERIPLENELSDDGDNVEDSWNHYIQLARQAAAEADLLGERVIADGLEMDRRAETALEELEQICGASIDARGLFASDGSDAVGAACPSGTCSGDGETCFLGTCVRDPVLVAEGDTSADPNLQRLRNCLADDTVVDLVTLGDDPLCVLRNGVELCPDTLDCPTQPDESGACPADPDGAGPMEWVPVDEPLGYFDNDELGVGPGGPPPCDEVRLLRGSAIATGSIAHKYALATMRAAGFFEPTRIRNIARAIGWEAHPFDTSTVTLGGRPFITTGDVNLDPGALTDWPCGDPHPNATCSPGTAFDGLFCSEVDASTGCADPTDRAYFNHRLARAVITARMLTATGYTGLFLPYMGMDASSGSGPAGFRDISISGGLLRVGSDPEFDALHVENSTYCTSGTTPVLWTQITPDAANPLTAACGSRPFTVFNKTRSNDQVDELFINDLGTGYASRYWRDVGAYPESATNTDSVLGFLSSDHRLQPSFVLNRMLYLPYDFARGYGWPIGAPIGDVSTPRGGQYHNEAAIGCSGGCEDPLYATQPFALFDITSQDLLDATELICEASDVTRGEACTSAPPDFNGVDDLPKVRDYFECVANRIEARAARTVFANVPLRALDALRRESSVGSYPALGGEYGAGVAALRGNLIELAEASVLLGAELRHLSNDVDALRIALLRNEIQADIDDIRFMQTVSSQLAGCAVAAANGTTGFGAGFAAAAATCANSIAQIAFADQISGLTDDDGELVREDAVVAFRDRFTTRTTALQGHATRISSAIEGIDSQLAGLEVQRRRGHRLLARAAFLDTDGMSGAHYEVNTVMRRRFNTNRVRYERAKENAIRMAYLAKRAVEQRLGMRLSSLGDDMTLVTAPATWEAELCTLEGLDYARIRDATDLPSDNFANGYIGDYVTKLELVVESYRLDYPFQNGEDTAVISLRDDVLGARAVCDTPVGNLLYHAGQLAVAAGAESTEGWARLGCAEDAGVERPNCVVGVPLDEGLRSETSPFITPHPLLSAVRGYRVSFGDLVTATACNAGTSNCGLTVDTEIGQSVALASGRYRLSWYAAQVDSGPLPEDAVDVRLASDGSSLLSMSSPRSEESADGAWERHWVFFDLDEDTEVRISVVPQPGGGDIVPQEVDVAALMLEDVTAEVPETTVVAADNPPRHFANTGSSLTRPQAACEDTTGDVFRSDWRYRCVRLCGEGFGRGCEGRVGANYCYWESQFVLTQRDIERGRTIRHSGFARGNYNYRTDTLALNFVGTNLRDCTATEFPSSCYSTGSIPYTVEHVGPYTVRNHRGEDYTAPLFTGRIEHGRGLAAERYLSNPLSTGDRSLVEPYLHREFRGRPLDGTYVIRVWDEPGVQFHNIEDIQILMNYRYWTRLD